MIPAHIRAQILAESHNSCAICGSIAFVELAHIIPAAAGGDDSINNLIVLCPTCHQSIDMSHRLSPELLFEIKHRWLTKARKGSEEVLKRFEGEYLARGAGTQVEGNRNEFLQWIAALKKYDSFDPIMTRVVNELAELKSEDEFINGYLRPILEWLQFRGITVLHHSGQLERGRDIVFYDEDRLGGLSFYAVVATKDKIHGTSQKSTGSGHYAKIIDQIAKCYLNRYDDPNLKSSFFIDKVLVASAKTITEDAVGCFRGWEDSQRRHLIYWNGPTIAGMILKMQVK